MSLPEPIESPDDDVAGEKRPNWLVGADEGVEAERGRHQRPDVPVELNRPLALPDEAPLELERPTPRLVRPDEDAAWNTLPQAMREGGAKPPPKPAKPVAWTAAASSVPNLGAVPRREPAPVEPDEDVDDEGIDEDGEEVGFPGPPAPASQRARAMRPAAPPLHEPVWMVVLEELASNRKLQMGIGAALVVVLAAWMLWPRERGASMAQIKRHPETFEGQTVRVQGRVGEVFPMGNGYVFNLHQGRDTVVVFTRIRTPVSRQKTEVQGSVSTGYLDGVARVAVFETQAP